MTNLKIGIIEDELIIARTIISTLDEIGYHHCGPAISYTEGIELLETEQPDLVLLDVQLAGRKDGIDLAQVINERFHLPFIFLTANSDAATLSRAKMVSPHAYIVKPFTKEDLFTAIEIAFHNFSGTEEKREVSTKPEPVKEFMFVKDGYRFQKVMFREVLYLQSEHNYVSVFLRDNQKLVVRSQFNAFVEGLPASLFRQVHRSYVVNLEQIEAVEPNQVIVDGVEIPVSPAFKPDLLKVLGLG